MGGIIVLYLLGGKLEVELRVSELAIELSFVVVIF